jgi:hypothetical protein
MHPYLTLLFVIAFGYALYYLLKDKLFDTEPLITHVNEHDSIEVRKAPLYPPRTIAPSGPSTPSQSASDEIIVHGEPTATDPQYNPQESSAHPETLRHPERSFRPPPLNDNTTISVQSGVSSEVTHSTSTQQYEQEMIQGGGEFMPGIFANDTFNNASYSVF